MEYKNLDNNIVRKDSFSPGFNSTDKLGGSGNNKNQPESNQDNDKKSFFTSEKSAFAWEFVKIIIIAAIIVLPIRYFIFQPFIVKGDSMIPNFHENNYLIVDEVSYRFVAPERGDVIVLKYPLDTTQRFIKRVIGLPGETVKIKNGKITITKDGKSTVLEETTYLPNSVSTDGDINVVLKDNAYFVLGDNRPFSYDSRRWGVLPKEDIVGRVIFRVFPFAGMGLISAPSY